MFEQIKAIVEDMQQRSNTAPSDIARVNKQERRVDSKRVLTALSGKQKEPNRGQGSDRKPSVPRAHTTGPTNEHAVVASHADSDGNSYSHVAATGNTHYIVQTHHNYTTLKRPIVSHEGPEKHVEKHWKYLVGESLDEAREKHTHKGHCQACGRQQAHESNGHIAKHGYTVDHGFFNGTCPGSGHKPLEHSHELCDHIQKSLHKDAEHHEKQLHDAKIGHTNPQIHSHTEYSKRDEYGNRTAHPVHVPYKEAGQNTKESWHNRMLNRAKMSRDHAHMLAGLKKQIHGQPLVSVQHQAEVRKKVSGERKAKSAHKDNLRSLAHEFDKHINTLQNHFLKIPHEHRTEAQSKVYYAPQFHHWSEKHSAAARKEFPAAKETIDAIDHLAAQRKAMTKKEEVYMNEGKGYPIEPGTHHSGEYSYAPARYAKNLIAVKSHKDNSGTMTRTARLANHFGRWTGRDAAHLMSHSAFQKFKAAHEEGKDASPITGKMREEIQMNDFEFKQLEEGIKAKMSPYDAHEFLTKHNAHGDFHALPSETAQHIRDKSYEVGFKHNGKTANGSRARYFHAALKRHANRRNSYVAHPHANAATHHVEETVVESDGHKKFKDVSIGDSFDFVSPHHTHNSFYKRVTKHSTRGYHDAEGTRYTVGSIHAKVYHHEPKVNEDRNNEFRANSQLSSSRGSRKPGHYLMKHGSPMHSDPHKDSAAALHAYKSLGDSKGVSIHQVKEDLEEVPGTVKTLSELKKSTLRNYQAKAGSQISSFKYGSDSAHARSPLNKGHVAAKRIKGVNTATKKLGEGVEEHAKFADHTKNPFHETLTKHGFVHQRTEHKQNPLAPKTPHGQHDYTQHVYTHPAHGKSHVIVTQYHDPHSGHGGKTVPHYYLHRHEQQNGIMAPSSGENKNHLHRGLSVHYGVPKGMEPPKTTAWEKKSGMIHKYKMNEVIHNANYSGQGHDPEHQNHPLHATITKHGYNYSHSTPIGRADGSKYISHTYKHSGHNVSTHSDANHGSQIWSTSTSTSSGVHHQGMGIPELEAHLKSKGKRHGLKKNNPVQEDAPAMSSGGAGDPGHVQNASDNYASQIDKRKQNIKNMLRRKKPTLDEATWHQNKAGPIKLSSTEHHVVTDPPNGLKTVFSHSTREKAETYLANIKKHHPHEGSHSYIVSPKNEAVVPNLAGHIPPEFNDVELGVVDPEQLKKNQAISKDKLSKKVGPGGVDEATGQYSSHHSRAQWLRVATQHGYSIQPNKVDDTIHAHHSVHGYHVGTWSPKEKSGWISKPHPDWAKDGTAPSRKWSGAKVSKESVEVNEVNRKTLHSYLGKAHGEYLRTRDDGSGRALRKITNRSKGIDRAIVRLSEPNLKVTPKK